MSVFPIISAIKRVRYRHSIRTPVGRGYNIVYICSHTMVVISVLLSGTQWAFTMYWLWHCTSARNAIEMHFFPYKHTSTAVAYEGNHLAQMYSHTHTHTRKCCARKWKMQVKLSIGVIQFLLLTALCDQKINPATKLIYLFLSLALLLTPSLLQIGSSYKPKRYTFLQNNLKTCSEKWQGVWGGYLR